MSVLPEEFPVVLTVFLALGAWRLSKQGVLTRNMPAIEALGAATVLAVDKTGTLTENRMVLSMLDDGATRLVLDGQRAAARSGHAGPARRCARRLRDPGIRPDGTRDHRGRSSARPAGGAGARSAWRSSMSTSSRRNCSP